MSQTYRLNKHCKVCNKLISDKNKSGFCKIHRDITGSNNPFYGKHHTPEAITRIKNTCTLRSHDLWNIESYRNSVIMGLTGKVRSDRFKEIQRNNALKQFENTCQRDIRSKTMKKSWKLGVLTNNIMHPFNFSKEELDFGKELKIRLGSNSKFLEDKATIHYGGKWIFPDFRYKQFIIEYNGDFWHANPKHYKKNDIIHHNITAKDIWDKDLKRKELYESLGYSVIYVWSSDYLKDKDSVLNNVVSLLIK